METEEQEMDKREPVVALIRRRARLVRAAMRLATVVLPVPEGP